jgi:hypothetical protein
MKTLAPVLSVAVSLALAACSSSSGGGDNSGNTNPGNPSSASIVLLAGDPGLTTGNGDGSGNAARFSGPMDITSDAAGNVYVADTGNHSVRKVTPAGAVNTLAYISDPAADPADQVNSVALDASGNLFVGDQSCPVNNITPPICRVGIHKVNSNGTLTSIVPTGSSDGTGTIINGLLDIAIDGSGRILISDVSVAGAKIRRLDPATGDIVTVAANTTSSSLAVAQSGTIYYRSNGAIYKWVAGASPVLLAGSPAGATGYLDGVGAAALLGGRGQISVDSSEIVYAADTDSQTVRRIGNDGTVTTIIGQAFNDSLTPGPLPGRVDKPSGTAVSGTTLYVSMPSLIAIVQGKP